MNSSPNDDTDDELIESALDWFLAVSPSSVDLKRRIINAQDYYLRHSTPDADGWPHTPKLILGSDVVASYLAQAESLIRNRRTYDLAIGARVVPFIKSVGIGLHELRRMPGVEERVSRMLRSNNDHPDSALFELVTAARYAHEGFEVRFIPEANQRMGDLEVEAGAGAEMFKAHVECKRLRPSVYELRETIEARRLFAPLSKMIHDKKLNVDVDVTFVAELRDIPDSHLESKVDQAINSRLLLRDGYPWRDEYSEGLVRPANIDRLSKELRDSYLLFGTKMARLLSGRLVSEGSYYMTADTTPRDGDPRYIDSVRFASVMTWRCLAEKSVTARARHVRSKIADIDQQLHQAPLGVAHIGMDAERDTVAADKRRELNLDAVRTFSPTSPLFEINMHYFLPRISEETAWVIDESVDFVRALPEGLLEDARVLGYGQSEDVGNRPAWHVPAPP
jgi:hypothetical protein